jgi:death-on-curing protein
VTEWITRDLVLAIHDAQIAEHGGIAGLRDPAVLDSILARPRQLAAQGDRATDIVALAAACAFGISQGRAFMDGNSRTSSVTTRTFLQLNGFKLFAGDAEKLEIWTSLAAGELSEEELAGWLRVITFKT